MRRISSVVFSAFSLPEIQLDPGVCTRTGRIQLLYGFWVNLAHLAIGLGFGFAAVQVPQLSRPNSEIRITRSDASWIASVLLLFCPVGCILSGIVMDRSGRRIMIIFSQVPMFIGWLYTGLAQTANQIIIARAITGVGCGMAMNPPRVFCTEMSLPNIRGVLGVFPSVALSLGIIVQAILDLFFHWTYLCYISCVFITANFFSFFFLPETPYFLLISKSAKDAQAALMKFRGQNYNINREMEQIIDFRDDNNIRELTFFENLEALCSKAACKPFFLIIAYVVIGQVAGSAVIMFWPIELLTAANSSFDMQTGNILLSLTRLFMGIITSILLYRVGRRPLALTSAVGLTVVCFTLGWFLAYYHEPSVVPIICFILYNVFANLGYSTLPHLMAFELFPLQVRGILGGALVSIHCLIMFTTTMMEPFILDTLGVDYLFVTFGVCSLVGCVFLFLLLPETKDLTLQEIEEHYKDIRPTLVSQRRIESMGVLAMQNTPKNSLTNLKVDVTGTMTSKTSMLAKLEAQRQLAIIYSQEDNQNENFERRKSMDSEKSTGRRSSRFNESNSNDEDVGSMKNTKSTGTAKSQEDLEENLTKDEDEEIPKLKEKSSTDRETTINNKDQPSTSKKKPG